MKQSKKELAYDLFSEGFESGSPEVKALGLKGTTRRTYYSVWLRKGRPATPGGPATTTLHKIVTIPKTIMLLTLLAIFKLLFILQSTDYFSRVSSSID